MEASSVVMRPAMVGIDGHSFYYNKSSMVMGAFDRRKQFNLGFCDKGHLDYYYYGSKSSSSSRRGGGRIRCGGGGVGGGCVKKEKVKGKEKEENKKMTKKKLKLLKSLSRDLSEMKMVGLGLADDQVKAKTISEAAELLLGELQKLRAEEKELKRKRKEEKALSRAALQLQNKGRLECDMSSSCSESSDSDGECGQEVVSLNRHLKCSSLVQQPISTAANQTVVEKETADISNISTEKESLTMCPLQPFPPTSNSSFNMGKESQVCSSNSLVEQECYSETRLVTGLSAKKIEVCMGGKCKKSGAAALLEEFHKVAGVHVAVSGCKCMGKCKDGPNVRVVNKSIDSLAADCVRTRENPLCIGVGLEDVGLIVADFFGEDQNEVGLAAVAAP